MGDEGLESAGLRLEELSVSAPVQEAVVAVESLSCRWEGNAGENEGE